MQIIDKEKERQAAERLNGTRRQQEAKLRKQRWEEENPPMFYLAPGIFSQFVKAQHGVSLREAYGGQMNTGAHYVPGQFEGAKQFFVLVIRDRGQLEQLEVDEYKQPNKDKVIPLPFPDQETERVLQAEAARLGIDYHRYLQAIFQSTVAKFLKADRDRAEESIKQMFDNWPVKVDGYISKELRDVLEAKYGKPRYNYELSVHTGTHFDLLVRAASEYLGLEPVKEKRS